jgi:hypothetical protein
MIKDRSIAISTINWRSKLSGNRIGIRTLDLNMSFANIRKQLDAIVDEWIQRELAS